MSNGGYKCFKKRDFGHFLYFAAALCFLGIGVLLLIQQDIGYKDIIVGLKVTMLICGLGILAGYFFNSRTRFRPGWTLPMGIVMTFIGAGYIAADIIKPLKTPDINLASIVMLVSFLNISLLLSTSVQVAALRLRRWRFYAAYAIANVIYLVFIYTDLFGIRTNAIIGSAIFMFILAIQLIVEGLIDLIKFEAARKRFNTSEEI